jgi:hypothetical protein
MKDNLPRFMIAENPLIESGREFVLHIKKPALLIEVFDTTDWPKDKYIEALQQFNVYGTTTVNEMDFLLVPVKLFDNPEFETQEDADRMAGLFRRAADWWHAYIKFEEKNAAE